jgi:1-acyl-sn-glycerol-3-phosphate acyltransferase
VRRIVGPLRGCLVVVGLAVVTAVLFPIHWIDVTFDRPAAGRMPVLWHRAARRLLNLRVVEHGRPAAVRPLLITANHVSWLDIVVLGSLMPLSFVAKAEVKTWPVFSFLARMQRTVYVDRSRRAGTGEATAAIAARLRRGDPMVLFAEGTSSNGNEVLPFRTALLGAARAALTAENGAVFVQPLSIAYTRLSGVPLGRRRRPLVAWYGDMDLAPHLWRLITSEGFDVEVSWGRPIPFDADADRKLIAGIAERSVRQLTIAALAGRPELAEPLLAR